MKNQTNIILLQWFMLKNNDYSNCYKLTIMLSLTNK